MLERRKKVKEVQIEDFYNVKMRQQIVDSSSSSGSEFDIHKTSRSSSSDEFYAEPDGYKQLLYKPRAAKLTPKVKVVKEFSHSK